MSGNVRRPSIAVSSVSSSIEGKETIGDALRKAKKELLFKRICIAMVLIVLAALVVYLCVSGYIPDLIDGFFALIE